MLAFKILHAKGSCLKKYPSFMRRPPVKTWLDNLRRQHIIYGAATVRSIDGEKRWSPLPINAAPLSRSGGGAWSSAKDTMMIKTLSFLCAVLQIPASSERLIVNVGVIENRLYIKTVVIGGVARFPQDILDWQVYSVINWLSRGHYTALHS